MPKLIIIISSIIIIEKKKTNMSTSVKTVAVVGAGGAPASSMGANPTAAAAAAAAAYDAGAAHEGRPKPMKVVLLTEPGDAPMTPQLCQSAVKAARHDIMECLLYIFRTEVETLPMGGIIDAALEAAVEGTKTVAECNACLLDTLSTMRRRVVDAQGDIFALEYTAYSAPDDNTIHHHREEVVAIVAEKKARRIEALEANLAAVNVAMNKRMDVHHEEMPLAEARKTTTEKEEGGEKKKKRGKECIWSDEFIAKQINEYMKLLDADLKDGDGPMSGEQRERAGRRFYTVATNDENRTSELVKSAMKRTKEELYSEFTNVIAAAQAVIGGTKQAREAALRREASAPKVRKVLPHKGLVEITDKYMEKLQNGLERSTGCRALNPVEFRDVRKSLFNAANMPHLKTEKDLDGAMRMASAEFFSVYRKKMLKEEKEASTSSGESSSAGSSSGESDNDTEARQDREMQKKKRSEYFIKVGKDEFQRIVNDACAEDDVRRQLSEEDMNYVLGKLAHREELMRTDRSGRQVMLTGMREIAFKVAAEYVFACKDEHFIFAAVARHNRKSPGKSSAMISGDYYDCAVLLAHSVFVFRTTRHNVKVNNKMCNVPPNKAIRAEALKRIRWVATRPRKGGFSTKITMSRFNSELMKVVEATADEFNTKDNLETMKKTKPDEDSPPRGKGNQKPLQQANEVSDSEDDITGGATQADDDADEVMKERFEEGLELEIDDDGEPPAKRARN